MTTGDRVLQPRPGLRDRSGVVIDTSRDGVPVVLWDDNGEVSLLTPRPDIATIVRARLADGFSKKAENHAYSVAIHMMHYNFVRIHQTLRCTPAMAAGVSTKLWELADMVNVLEEWETR